MAGSISSAAISRNKVGEHMLIGSPKKHWSDYNSSVHRNMESYFYLLDRNLQLNGQIDNPSKMDCLTIIKHMEILNKQIKRLKTEKDNSDLKKKIEHMESKLKQYLIARGINNEVIESKIKKITKADPKHKWGPEIAKDIFEEYKLDELSEKNRSHDENSAYSGIAVYFEYFDCNFRVKCDSGGSEDMYDTEEVHFLTDVYVEILNRKMKRQKSVADKNATKMKIDIIESTFLSALEFNGYCLRLVDLTDDQMDQSDDQMDQSDDYEPKTMKKDGDKYKDKDKDKDQDKAEPELGWGVFKITDKLNYNWGTSHFQKNNKRIKKRKLERKAFGATDEPNSQNNKRTKTQKYAT